MILPVVPKIAFDYSYYIRNKEKYMGRPESYLRFAVGVSLLMGIITVSLYSPIWLTNDDVGMSMRAHGYGSFHDGSSLLIFSNVLWGGLVRSLPTINGVLGYSLAALITLWISIFLCLYFFRHEGLSPIFAIILMILVFFQPLIFPQFTLNSGILSITALLGLRHYLRTKRVIFLILFVGLCLASFLIRSNEFFMLMLIALPFIIEAQLFKDKALIFSFVALLTLIALGSGINKAYYQSADWYKFTSFNELRVNLIDYGGAQLLQSRPDILKKYGFSVNDMELLKNWFYADASISNAEAIRGMLDEAGTKLAQSGSVKEGASGLVVPFKDRTGALFILIVIIALSVYPSARAVTSVCIFLSVLFYLGAIGRPALFRIYYPALCLLAIFTIVVGRAMMKKDNFRKRLSVGAMLALAASVNIWHTSEAHGVQNAYLAQIQRDIRGLPNTTLFAWGGEFPYEHVYPVLDTVNYRRDLDLYSFASSTFAPTSNAEFHERSGDGFVAKLLSSEGAPFVQARDFIGSVNANLLSLYCAEHHGGKLDLRRTYQSLSLQVVTARCIE